MNKAPLSTTFFLAHRGTISESQYHRILPTLSAGVKYVGLCGRVSFQLQSIEHAGWQALFSIFFRTLRDGGNMQELTEQGIKTLIA